MIWFANVNDFMDNLIFYAEKSHKYVTKLLKNNKIHLSSDRYQAEIILPVSINLSFVIA
jgi:hypothetical protein